MDFFSCNAMSAVCSSHAVPCRFVEWQYAEAQARPQGMQEPHPGDGRPTWMQHVHDLHHDLLSAPGQAPVRLPVAASQAARPSLAAPLRSLLSQLEEDSVARS
jgi:hypothetical protein